MYNIVSQYFYILCTIQYHYDIIDCIPCAVRYIPVTYLFYNW